jgi:hypothetical protein
MNNAFIFLQNKYNIFIIFIEIIKKMNNKILRKELLCDFLLNNNELETEFGTNPNHYIKKVSFRKDEDKNLLYSQVYLYHDTHLDFIYKLSKEIEECKRKFYK